ncbi:dnaJ homolog subfamily C member 9-like isoform X1 [Lycorma delicatula]|uniref:dnaJ homolog subfamily C member 9-like isoform X1 n=1 Tax=Lycorma delicatula TaxID=130591 RepID=UPI003F512699
MPGLIESCQKYFGSKDLYEILNIPRTATDKEVRKAYHRLSLLVHPDRVDEEQKLNATEKFKVLGKIHTILSDSGKRALYNSTGSWDDEDDELEDGKDWDEYWRMLFKEITIEDINNYEKKYKESDEELADLKRAYMDRKGDMNYILEAVPFTHTNEEPRLRKLIQGLIDRGEVPEYDAFVNETPQKRERRKRKWEKEAQQAARLEAELERQRKKKKARYDDNSMEDELSGGLEKALMERKKNREASMNSFFDHLGAKYASPKQKEGKKNTARTSTDRKGRKQT